MTNDEVNKVRIEAYKKHGPCRIIRLRLMDDSIRFYVCQMLGERILTVLAGGDSDKEILKQL